uniref:Putative 8.9 kDa protein n=1 Tax=Ixodes ricinus TaxID=34613 RepID=A0A0K8R2Z8_IXORI
MKFSSHLFCGLVAVFTAWSLADAYVARAKAENRDGKCFFNNVTIEHGNAYLSREPVVNRGGRRTTNPTFRE